MHEAALMCYMLDDPNETFLWDGDIKSKAAQKIYLVKEMFEDDYFIRLFGDLKGDKWKKDEMVLKRTVKTSDPTLMSSGLDSSKTGTHPGVIFGDDQQTDDNADNPEMNEQVKTNFRLYESLHRGKPNPLTLMDGTRWGFRDLGYLIQDMKEEEARKGLKPSIFITRIAGYKRDINGKFNYRAAEFPEAGLTLENLKRMRMMQKPALFSLNILLVPHSAEDAPFKKEFIRYHNFGVAELAAMGANFWLMVDPAGDGRNKDGKQWKGADFNALVCVAVTPENQMYVMEVVNKHLKQMELFAEIVRFHESYPELRVMVETYFQQHALAKFLRDKAGESLIAINWAKFKADFRKKAVRIGDLEPFFSLGRISWRREHTELEDQVLTWTGKEEDGRHDDLVDCLGHLLQQVVKPTVNPMGKWELDDNYADRPEYQELVAKGKAPSHMMVLIRASEERAKQARIGRSSGRFSMPGMRRRGFG